VFYAEDNPRNRKASHDWRGVKVTGSMKLVPAAPRNGCEFAKALRRVAAERHTVPGVRP
jgi:hypothetical protein